MFRHKNKIIGLLICLGIFAVAGFVFAQPDLGLTNEFANQAGLGAKPIGQTIAEIVRIFLSVLGIIAVILILYAGFLWMTAAGEAEKIATAKKILINGVIGLAIILSSLAITQFIIGALEKATGTYISGEGGGPGGGGGLPSDAFTVKGISPQGSIPIRNVVVRIAFNHQVQSATVSGNILITKKSDNGIVAGDFAIAGDKVEFTPSAACPAPNISVKCFDADTAYRVEVKTVLKDTGGKDLQCGGFAPKCTAEFTTGSLVDVTPPQVAITYPDPGQSVSQNAAVDVWAHAADDSAISHIEFFADGAYFDKAFPPGASPPVFDGRVYWSTAAVTKGSHGLSAKAYDIDGNNTFSAPLNVIVRAEHCFNNIKDTDETGLDCGGADCAVCSGGACTQNSDCASMSCQNSICVNTPIILGLSPTDGAPGIYVTISGRYFGTAGTVTFLGGTGPADDKVAQLAPCNGAWSDRQIIVSAPQGMLSGPIEVKTTVGADATNDARGPALPNFVVTPTLRPGICSLTPAEGKSGTTFIISGTEFGANQGTSFIKFGNVYASPQTWGNAAISALVPVLSAGENSVQVNRGGVDSNAVTFKVLSLTSGTKPTINYVDPGQGPAGEYITIFGSNFGEALGVVQFLRADGTVALGDTKFPEGCGKDYWHNSYVTVKVPDKFSDGSSTKNVATSLRLRRFDNAISNVISFPINSDTPKPGICGLNPDNGPIGTPVDILGERFGAPPAGGGAVIFYNNVGAAAIWGSEMIKTAVPKGAVSGPVKITVGGKDSNSVNFSIGDCFKAPALCTVDQQCCAASCIPKNQTCQVAPKEGAYAWHISTGIIPRAPHVVEDCSTGDKAANPSPSPWDARPGGNTVCVNGIVNVRFDSKLDPATVVMNGVAADTVALYKCTGVSPAPCATRVKVALDPLYTKLYSVNATDDGVQLYPAGRKLEKDTQYLVELTTKIRGAGAGGGYMEEKSECGAGLSYCFNFKTINSDSLCRVGSLVTSPQDYLSDKKELLEYISSPRAKDDVCLNINASLYTYAWSSSQLFPPNHASINKIGFNLAGQPVQNEAVIESLSETNPGDPAIITSAILAVIEENVSGKANLTIKFADPEVVDRWPLCNTACVNSTIGASFNVDMDPATIIPANVTVFVCATENCDSFSGTVIGAISYDVAGRKFDFSPSQNLAVSTFYLARLDALSIRSVSGVALTGANPGRYYVWQFRTRADATPCVVNKVNVSPQSQIYNYIPQISEFNSEALGAPDACNPQGQRLNSYSYNWSWNSGVPAVVSLSKNGAYNVLPPSGGGCNDRCLRTGSMPGASVCGNGKIEKGESCDLDVQNGKPGSTCAANCLNVGTAAPTCGNSMVNPGEDCDLGAQNGKAESGCSDKCLSLGSASGNSICGNYVPGLPLGKGENCDDGNATSGDGCSSQCLNEGTQFGIASCGNGMAEKNLGEDCDDGNTVSGDGCSTVCLNEGSIAGGTTCGNGGLPEKGEDCDDGNIVSGDGCSSICLNEGSNLKYDSICGNGGAPETGESCDASSSDTNVDPRQYGAAVGKGITKINATTQNVSGSSDVEVLCVYITDAQCQAFGADKGVGQDNCCYVRPQVTPIYPKLNETGVCRNTLISASFNQIMDGVVGEISIDQRKNGSSCPAGSKEIVDSGVTWCQGAIKATRSILDDVKNKKTEFDWNINNLLDSGKTYRVVLTNFKNKGGVLQMINPYSWTFTAGNDICKIDKVEVTPAPIIFNNIKPASAANPNGSPQQAMARAISLPNRPLSSIAGIYAWDWEWSPLSTDSISVSANAEVATITAKDKNGETMLVATANITADIAKSSAEKSISGTARVIVFLCENPWPGLQTFPYTVDTTANASTYYCRDNLPKFLPNLNIVSVPGAGDILKEFLFTDPESGDAVGVRIYQNPNHLSPLAWYKGKMFVGSPSASQVDGYEAIVDGRTTYVNAANHLASGSNYTNTFVISYNQAAPPEIQNIYKQILDNWKFNINLTNVEKCAATGEACSSDLDCGTGVCSADKDKIRRDTKRLADFNNIAETLENYKIINNSYPQILSGSFLRGRSVSVWPSWQAVLGNDLGRALAVDPVNKHVACTGTAYSGYDSATCWNGAAGQYACPAGSRVYNYKNITQDSYQFGGDFEYNGGAGWNNINSNFKIQGSCSGAAEGTSAKCGDGVVGTGEACEKGNEKLDSCTTPNGKTGNQKLTCRTDCKWDTSAPCQAGQCGDGIKQTNEVCDDGQNNGKYGYCDTACSGKGMLFCGDGNPNGPEQCDKGANNGVYGFGCSWDCKKPGPICGDNIVQSFEECDGNSETLKINPFSNSKEACGIDAATGYQKYSKHTCAADCVWGGWSICQTQDKCGNSTKEGNEECDTVSGTSGSCVMDIIKGYACKNATCGDGYLQTGKEACDSGTGNGKECTAPYSLTCNYCGTSCNVITKTGPYCGDLIKNGPEECDNNNFGGMTCGSFVSGATGDLKCNNCKIDTSSCPPPPSGPVCGDGKCQGDENCGSCKADCGCASGQSCVSGQCMSPPPPPPPSGPVCGDGKCQGDENCGSCKADCGCASGQSCVSGQCMSPPPPPPPPVCGPLDCSTLLEAPCNLYFNECGDSISCGKCPARQDCKNGRCVPGG